MTIRVLIVDDHPVFRDGLTAALAASDGIEVAATAGDGPATAGDRSANAATGP